MVLDRNRAGQLRYMKVIRKKGIKQVLSATDSVPDPADFPIGSAASPYGGPREARKATPAPPLLVHFAVCSGERLPCDEVRLDGKTVPRSADEFQEEFGKRLLGMVPRGRPAVDRDVPSASEAERDEVHALHSARTSGIPEFHTSSSR